MNSPDDRKTDSAHSPLMRTGLLNERGEPEQDAMAALAMAFPQLSPLRFSCSFSALPVDHILHFYFIKHTLDAQQCKTDRKKLLSDWLNICA